MDLGAEGDSPGLGCCPPSRNEVGFHTEGTTFDSWTLGLENANAAGHSAKSVYGGHTWRSVLMGFDASLQGEDLVRLWLDRHAPHGALTSPVLDLGTADPEVRSPVRAAEVSARVEAEAPPGHGRRVGLACRRHARAAGPGLDRLAATHGPGTPGPMALLLEADHNDPRAYSEEQVANRLDAFIEMLGV